MSTPSQNYKYKYGSGSSGASLFGVNITTGVIYSISTLGNDASGVTSVTYTLTVQVMDSQGNTSTALYYITVNDKNDNAPHFGQHYFMFYAQECWEAGAPLGYITGGDGDTEYQNNNAIYFKGGGEKMQVTADGLVILSHPCVDGETTTGSATIHDQFIYPGPLSGVPATINIVCYPCMTTPTTAATTSVYYVVTPLAGDYDFGDMVACFFPALIGGGVFLVLITFCMCR